MGDRQPDVLTLHLAHPSYWTRAVAGGGRPEQWSAWRRDGTGEVLAAAGPRELERLIEADEED